MRIGFIAVAVSSLAAIGGLVWLLRGDSTGPQAKKLMVYYAAGLRLPIEEVIDKYAEKYGVQIHSSAQGSGELLGNIVATEMGDIFIAADASYLTQLNAVEKRGRTVDMVEEIIPIAWQRPVIAVAKGNPKGIESLQDLLRDDVRVSLADPDIAAIGRAARSRMDESLWNRIWAEKHVGRPKVPMVAQDVSVGAADAGIVWDATAAQFEKLDAVAVPQFDVRQNQIAIGVLPFAKDPTRALHFSRYLTAKDRGLPHFEKHGYRVIDGDQWAEKPEITLYCGGLNWVAAEDIVKEFQRREGCTVLTNINGCGKLVGEMKLAMKGKETGSPADMYFACDASYMLDVQKWFGDRENVSRAAMVIAVGKGNPHEIHSVRDLAKGGLKIGICDPSLSALGGLTKTLLDAHGIYGVVLNNTKDRPATAAVLVERVALGNLDAAIVYVPNLVNERENLEVITIDDPKAIAVQPVAVGKGSKYPHLTGRLMQRLLSPQSRGVFEKHQFQWAAASAKQKAVH